MGDHNSLRELLMYLLLVVIWQKYLFPVLQETALHHSRDRNGCNIEGR